MNTRRFVSTASVVLAAWLGATFFNEVPAKRYPKLDKSTAAAKSPKETPIAPAMNTVTLPAAASH